MNVLHKSAGGIPEWRLIEYSAHAIGRTRFWVAFHEYHPITLGRRARRNVSPIISEIPPLTPTPKLDSVLADIASAAPRYGGIRGRS